MKKFSKVLILGTVMALPISLTANHVEEATSNNAEVVELAQCTIDKDGFKATGRCGAVLKAYKKWKALNM